MNDRISLVKRQEMVRADYMTLNRYADISGHLGTAGIIAAVAALTFEASYPGAVTFSVIAVACLGLSRAFDKRASHMEAKARRMQYLLDKNPTLKSGNEG